MKIIINYILIALCSITIPLSTSNLSAKENSIDTEIVFTEESINKLDYEMGPDSPYAGQMLTYTVDENNNIIRIEDQIQTKSVATIAVFVGGTLVGYLTSTVIDGIVISATGQSGGWWVSQAIQNVLKRNILNEHTLIATYIQCILMKELCVENMSKQKIISFVLGISLYIILCIFITDYTMRLIIGLILFILYLGFIFILKNKNEI